MMYSKKIIFIIFALLLSTTIRVNASDFEVKIDKGKCTYLDLHELDIDTPYRYAEVNINSASTSYTVGLYGMYVSGFGTTFKTLGTSVNLSGTGKVYILPRAGMNCPSGSKYCFGVGPIPSTKIANSSDCNGNYCLFYGIEICNKGSSELTIKGSEELYTD